MQKTCPRCGVNHPESSFRPNGAGRLRNVCRWCEQKRRDTLKRQNRFMSKARWAIQYQAARHGMTAGEFRQKYGWDAPRLAADMGHVYHRLEKCPVCGVRWSKLLLCPWFCGYSNITLTIRDRAKEPFYRDNVVICCKSCSHVALSRLARCNAAETKMAL